jgi:hypothetical protein
VNPIFASITDVTRRDAVMFFAGHTSGAMHLK